MNCVPEISAVSNSYCSWELLFLKFPHKTARGGNSNIDVPQTDGGGEVEHRSAEAAAVRVWLFTRLQPRSKLPSTVFRRGAIFRRRSSVEEQATFCRGASKLSKLSSAQEQATTVNGFLRRSKLPLTEQADGARLLETAAWKWLRGARRIA